MDAFISHSSRNRALASQLEQALATEGLSIWLDDSDIRLGALLREELQTSISRCKVLVLLWSRPASRSRWINAEWLMAVHTGKFIIPCTLDAEALPQCLQSNIALNVKRVGPAVVERLARAIREAPATPNRLARAMRSEAPELGEAVAMIARDQGAVTDQLGKRDTAKAAELQALLDTVMEHATQDWPLDPMIVNLHAYHMKNGYMVKHWDAIQAGRGPRDDLLDQAERRFFETLSLDPTDPSALNGLGSVLILERELDAAEFFVRAAIAAAKKRGLGPYPAADHDLQLILYYKGGQP